MPPSTTFNSSRWWVDIVLTKDDIRTLVDIVIANPTWMDLFPWSCAIQRFATLNIIQGKERNYRNRHSTNQFLLLIIEIFGYLHKHAYMFLHDCANAIWSLKGSKGLIFLLWSLFFVKKFRSHYKGCNHPTS